MSSAYWSNLTPKLDMTSLSEVVNRETSSEPGTDPCGMPVSWLSLVDDVLPTLTKHERPSS